MDETKSESETATYDEKPIEKPTEKAIDPILWPESGQLSESWLAQLADAFKYGSWNLPPTSFLEIMPLETVDKLLKSAYKVLHAEPNVVEVNPQEVSGSSVTVVGDIHGQYHDALHLFWLAGPPDDTTFFVFNGDYVDRGAWGVETYLYLLAWKVFLPNRVFLLRGNHETKYCSSHYGFEKEVMTKFSSDSSHVFRWFLACFESHPLAAIIGNCTYVSHGGLFRKQQRTSQSSQKGGRSKAGKGSRKSKEVLQLGTLTDLSRARRTLLDPSGKGPQALAADVLWSDPCPEPCPGLAPNTGRGIGLLFGPDCTQQFLIANDLKLIIRSHEGPDARAKRPEMASMNLGYTIDHEVQAGRLITLFSAPDYPQFQSGKKRYNNKAAYIVLNSPDFSDPNFKCFDAVLPRPKATAFYDFVNVMDSDEELDLGQGSDGSGSDISDFGS